MVRGDYATDFTDKRYQGSVRYLKIIILKTEAARRRASPKRRRRKPPYQRTKRTIFFDPVGPISSNVRVIAYRFHGGPRFSTRVLRTTARDARTFIKT